jgi:hypothetical protein
VTSARMNMERVTLEQRLEGDKEASPERISGRESVLKSGGVAPPSVSSQGQCGRQVDGESERRRMEYGQGGQTRQHWWSLVIVHFLQ